MNKYDAKNIFSNTTGYTYDDLILLPGFISHSVSDINLEMASHETIPSNFLL